MPRPSRSPARQPSTEPFSGVGSFLESRLAGAQSQLAESSAAAQRALRSGSPQDIRAAFEDNPFMGLLGATTMSGVGAAKIGMFTKILKNIANDDIGKEELKFLRTIVRNEEFADRLRESLSHIEASGASDPFNTKQMLAKALARIERAKYSRALAKQKGR